MFFVNKPFPSSWAWISSQLENLLLGKKYKQIPSSTCETCLIFSRQLFTYTLRQSGHTCRVLQSRVREIWSFWMGSEGPGFKAWPFRCMRLLCPSYWLIPTSGTTRKAWCRRTDTCRDAYRCKYECWGMRIHWSQAFQLHLYGTWYAWNLNFELYSFPQVSGKAQFVCSVWYGVGQAICYLHTRGGY